jgi:hypothetical protein
MASDAFERFGIFKAELEEMIRSEAAVNSALNDFMENEVVPYWKSVSPVGDSRVDDEAGAYRASVKVTKKAKRGRGAVGATDYKAHWIEYGTGEPFPTPEFAPREKTAAHFGGDAKGGITTGVDSQ